MKLIIFESVTLRTFRSFAAETTIRLSDDAGLCFLTGRNEVDPTLGANGTGKSTILDGIVWCLYGVSVRGQRASDLASWGMNERPFVSMVLDINDDGELSTYNIERIGSPDRLVLNGEVVPQTTIDSLIGLSRLRFVHSVIFGQAAPLFMDLSVPDRGALFDEMMDLSVWAKRSLFAARDVVALTKQIHTLESEITFKGGRISGLLEQIDTLQTMSQHWTDEHSTQADSARDNYVEADSTLRVVEQEIRYIQGQLDNTADAHEWTMAIDELRQRVEHANTRATTLSMHLLAFSDESKLLSDNRICPACKQPITAHYASARLARLAADQAEAQAQADQARQEAHSARDQLNLMLGEQLEAAQASADLRSHMANAQNTAAAARQILVAARQRLDSITQHVNPYQSQIINLVQTAKTIETEIDTKETERAALSVKLTHAEYWKRGFLLIRLFIIGRLLGMLEIETASAAAALGLGNWQITFATETETKSGTVRPGIHAQAINPRQQGDYRSYSPGEAQRIKLAVTLGLASLIHSMAGVYLSVEAWDEPTNWLSQEGIDDLVESLSHRADESGKSVWLIDHRSLTFPFDAVYEAVKNNQGTNIKKIR